MNRIKFISAVSAAGAALVAPHSVLAKIFPSLQPAGDLSSSLAAQCLWVDYLPENALARYGKKSEDPAHLAYRKKGESYDAVLVEGTNFLVPTYHDVDIDTLFLKLLDDSTRYVGFMYSGYNVGLRFEKSNLITGFHEAFVQIEKHRMTVATIIAGKNVVEEMLRCGDFTASNANGKIGHFWYADVLASEKVNPNVAYFLVKKEFLGVIPVRREVGEFGMALFTSLGAAKLTLI